MENNKPVITRRDVEVMLGERFKIEELAGNGGFGDVYRGYDNRMNREVAIKVVGSLGDREARMLTELDHKGLPRLYDVVRGDSVTIMIMEWIAGVDLEKYISKKGAISEKSAVRIGRELLEILEYLHSLSPAIVYQDLKPSNIMIMPDGHIRLVDFGTALVLDYGDDRMHYAGTVGYGAPEQRGITGSRHASVRSDLYAWGGVMYSMLSGIMLNKPPYTMKKIRCVCPEISYGLAHVIGVCTRRNERDRYPDARTVINALGKRKLVNAVCRTAFITLFIACVVPFIRVWYGMYASGTFELMEARFRTALWLLHTGEEVNCANIPRTLHYLSANDALSRSMGFILLTGAWMCLGLKLLQGRRYIRIRRSIYLSRRKYPGLWIPTLLAGIVFGYGLCGTMPAFISRAEELSETSYDRTGRDDYILPLCLMDTDGNMMLLDYGAPYSSDDDLYVRIGHEVTESGGHVSVTCVSADGRSGTRTIPIE